LVLPRNIYLFVFLIVQLEGSASVVPTVATLADLCYHCHSGSGSNYHGDTISSSRNGETGQGEEGHMGPAVLVARHGYEKDSLLIQIQRVTFTHLQLPMDQT
jgi:hypothetical protein